MALLDFPSNTKTVVAPRSKRVAGLVSTVLILAMSFVAVQLSRGSTASADPAVGPGVVSSTTSGAITSGTIPDGTCRAAIAAIGGSGGSSGLSATTGGVGGGGASVSAVFAVLPGQSYSGAVGGGGTTGASGVGGISGATGGGGNPGTIPSTGGHRGAGGGGRTEVSIAGNSVVVAGGGGGGGAAHNAVPAGSGGGAGVATSAGAVGVGIAGSNGVDTGTNTGGAGGGAGGGGAGGVNSTTATFNGAAGLGIGVGTGGNGGPDTSYDTAGGGGGGYTGGGGGASTVTDSVSGGGGGGGSSFVAATSPVAAVVAPTGIASSALAPTATGSKAGANGSLSIDWQPCVYDLAISKSASPASVAAGSTTTWTIVVKNNGPDPMTKGDTLDLTDTLPVGPNGLAAPTFKVLSVLAAGGTNANMDSGAITCTGLVVGSTMPGVTNCSRAYNAPGAPGAPTGGPRGLNVGESLTITYEQNIAVTASCPSTITNVASIKDRPSSSGTTDLIGVIKTDSSSAPLNIACLGPKLKLVKALSANRHAASDQFTMAISPSGAALSGGSATSAGAGSVVTPNTGAVEVAFGTAGLSYTFSEAMASGSASALSEYGQSVSCANAKFGSSTLLPALGSSIAVFSIIPAGGDDITCTLTNRPLASSLTITKSTTSTSFSTVGASIPYQFVVTNSGAVTLNSINITDPKVTGISCLVTSLTPGTSTTCTATHIVTQGDLDAGTVVNVASVTGTPPGGSPIPPTNSTAINVPAVQIPALTIVKSTTKVSYSTIGESILYSFAVKNTGNVILTGVGVADPKVSGVSCAATTLAPGVSTTCTGLHTVTQSDLDTTSVVNTATVSGTPPSGIPTTPVSSNIVTVPAAQSSSLSIAKASSTPSFGVLGESISYNFTVKNNGNVNLTAITVIDPMVSAVSCSVTSLLPGVSTTCTGTRNATQSDLNAGSVMNVATVVGTPPSGVATAPASSNVVTVPAIQDAVLTIVKATTKASYALFGELIPYTFTVQNIGNVTLTSVTVTDPKATGIACAATSLAPGDSTTCSGSHAVTQADLDGTQVVNTATVVGTPPSGAPTSPISSNSVTVASVQTPAVTIVKSTTKTGYTTVGEVVPYSFAVRNTGNVTLTAINVTDPKTTGVSCPVTSLVPGAATTCTGTHLVSQGDLDTGSVANTAQVGATPPSGTPLVPTSSNTITVTATQSPSLTISKSSSTPDFSASGKTITYSFTVTNTGNVTISDVAVADPQTGSVTCASTTLLTGVSTTCAATHTTTATDVANASVVNTASVTGRTPFGTTTPPVSSNTVAVPLLPLPGLDIVKSSASTSYSTLGSAVGYTFTVANSGNTPLRSLRVTDPNATGITCASNTLALNASTTCTGTHIVTQADLDTGSIINTAAATVDLPSGQPIGPVSSNTLTIPAGQTASLNIAKSTTTPSVSAVNETIAYTFRVTNTGNVSMTAIAVTDPKATGITCPTTSLAPGSFVDCTGTHNVTQVDLDTGAVVNTASAIGTPPNGITLAPTPSNTVTVPVNQNSSLTVAKATNSASYTAAGDVVPYSFRVVNTGNVTMTGVAVTDAQVTGITCPVATLAPGAATTCAGSRTVTLTDLNAGSIVNTASATGTPPTGPAIAPIASNTVTVPGAQAPSLSILKSTSQPSVSVVGETLPYTFAVTNTGNITINSVSVTDPIVSGITCSPTALDPREVASCSGTRTATQADLDAGSVVNTATASGKTPTGQSLTPVASNTITVPAVQNPSLTIAKSSSKTTISTVGELISYSFRVTNTGNVSITNVAVTDPITGVVLCSPTDLAPAQFVDCTATHSVTQADLDSGSVVNTASVVGTPPSGTPLAPVGSNIVTVTATQNASLTIAKSTTATTYATLGASVPYFFDVKNTGNVTLTGLTVNDPKIVSVSCVATDLAPGASTTCSGTHIVTQADLDVGSLMNTATATATPPSGTPIAPVPSNTITVPATQRPALSVAKATTNTSVAAVNEAIPYTFVVTNIGNVTMTGVIVLDPNAFGIACAATLLSPSASTTCTGTHLVTQPDLNGTGIVNTASVVGTPPSGTPIAPVSSNTVTVAPVQSPNLEVTKATATGSYSNPGDTITYTFNVVNTGNVTITGIAINDEKLTSVSCALTTLDGGQATTCTGTHAVIQADLDGGSVINTASVSGTPPGGTALAPIPSNTVTVPAIASPQLSMVKATTTTNFANVNDEINYTFTVTNTGNQTLTGVTVTDPKARAISCPGTTLNVGENMECTSKHVVTQADLNAGFVANTAAVVGTPPVGREIVPIPSNTVTVPAVIRPRLSAAKIDGGTPVNKAGDVIAYSVLVTNEGNVTMALIKVDDPIAPSLNCPVSSLDPGFATTCTGIHIVTQAEVDSGVVTNTAFVTGKPPVGAPISPVASNTNNVKVVPDPKLSLAKAASNTGYSAVGDQIAYTFEVTNIGNVTMHSVSVNDPNVSGLSCLANSLAPTETTTCVGTHTVAQTDVDSGNVVNTATVVGTPPSGPAILPVSSNTVTVPAEQAASVIIAKATDTASVATAGDSIPYRFTVTNNGNVTLHDLIVTDPNATGITCPFTVLAPSQSTTCHGTHLVTQLDLDSGSIVNMAKVAATPPSGPALPSVDSNIVTVPVSQHPSLTIRKSALDSNYSTLNEIVRYSFTVRNSGNVTMTAISVSDAHTSAVTCTATGLSPGGTTPCNATHIVTQADLDAGSIVNTAEVVGLAPGASTPTAPVASNSITVPALQSPSLIVAKSTAKLSAATLGEIVPYTFIVTNTGNVTITAVTVTDPLVIGMNCTGSAIVPRRRITCTASHQVTQADLDLGSVVNIASVVGTPPSRTPLSPVSSNTITVPIVQTPALTILKSTTSGSVLAVGDIVPYRFTVRNSGNVTMTSVTVTDPNATGITCALTTLAPRQQTTCSATHTVTLVDLDAGSIVNTAQVSGTPPTGSPIPPVNSNTLTLPAVQSGSLTITKTADLSRVSRVGEAITYTFTITNNGNVTLRDLVVVDPITTVPVCVATTLAPGASTTCTATRNVTQDDLTRGSVVNTATATATPPAGQSIEPATSNIVVVPAHQLPRLSIAKSTTATHYGTPGDSIPYLLLVTNTGNVPVSAIVVDDPIAAPVTCPVRTLAPSESTTCTGVHVVTFDDIVRGSIVNVAAVSGIAPLGAPSVSAPSNEVVVRALVTAIALVPPTSPGSPSPESTSSTPNLTPPTTIDPRTNDSGSSANAAQGSATSPSTETNPSASLSPQGNGAPANNADPAAISLDKRATSGYSSAGDVITYTFVVTNTGRSPLAGAHVIDTMPGLSQVDCGTFHGALAVGASTTCSATYTVTAADIARGSISNTANVQAVGAKSFNVLGKSTAKSVRIDATALPFTGSPAKSLSVFALLFLTCGALLMRITKKRSV